MRGAMAIDIKDHPLTLSQMRYRLPYLTDYGRLFRQTKKNARSRGIEWRLSDQEITEIIVNSHHRCEITGIEFRIRIINNSIERISKDPYFRNPWAPSVDRIHASGDYTAENVRLVAAIVNQAMGTWGDEDFWTMVRAAAPLAPPSEAE